jgi:hypothetical protein
MSGEIAPDHPSRCHVIIQIKRLDMECRAPRLRGMASRTKKAIRGPPQLAPAPQIGLWQSRWHGACSPHATVISGVRFRVLATANPSAGRVVVMAFLRIRSQDR